VRVGKYGGSAGWHNALEFENRPLPEEETTQINTMVLYGITDQIVAFSSLGYGMLII